MKKYAVCRPVDGISINECSEFLLDENDRVRIFDSLEDAKDTLRADGYTEEELRFVNFLGSCGRCWRCGSPLFPSFIEGYTCQCFSCDEDFYAFEQNITKITVVVKGGMVESAYSNDENLLVDVVDLDSVEIDENGKHQFYDAYLELQNNIKNEGFVQVY